MICDGYCWVLTRPSRRHPRNPDILTPANAVQIRSSALSCFRFNFCRSQRSISLAVNESCACTVVLNIYFLHQVYTHIVHCCTEFVNIVLHDSKSSDRFWIEQVHALLSTGQSSYLQCLTRACLLLTQIAREAHKRFGYDLFRSCAVKDGASFEVSTPPWCL